jgi:hypothetical protein
LLAEAFFSDKHRKTGPERKTPGDPRRDLCYNTSTEGDGSMTDDGYWTLRIPRCDGYKTLACNGLALGAGLTLAVIGWIDPGRVALDSVTLGVLIGMSALNIALRSISASPMAGMCASATPIASAPDARPASTNEALAAYLSDEWMRPFYNSEGALLSPTSPAAPDQGEGVGVGAVSEQYDLLVTPHYPPTSYPERENQEKNSDSFQPDGNYGILNIYPETPYPALGDTLNWEKNSDSFQPDGYYGTASPEKNSDSFQPGDYPAHGNHAERHEPEIPPFPDDWETPLPVKAVSKRRKATDRRVREAIDRMAPDRMAPDRMAPERMAPDRIVAP